MKASRFVVLLSAAAVHLGCGDDDGGGSSCPAEGQSLEMLAPAEGESIDPSHDVDPAMGGLQYEIAVLACGFDPGSQVEVWVTAPFESRYAVLDVESAASVARAAVSFVPGDLTMEARSVDGAVRSGGVSFHVSVD